MNKEQFVSMMDEVTLENNEILSVTFANTNKGKAYTTSWAMRDTASLDHNAIDIGELAGVIYRFLNSRSGRMESKMREFISDLMRIYNEGARYERIAIDRMLEDAKAIVSHKKKPFGDL